MAVFNPNDMGPIFTPVSGTNTFTVQLSREQFDRLVYEAARGVTPQVNDPMKVETTMAKGKTLRKLLMDELRTDDEDKVDAVADVVLDWLQRNELNQHVILASYWREKIEENRKSENQNGLGL